MSSKIETITLRPSSTRLVELANRPVPNRDESIAAARASFRVADPTFQAALRAEVATARPELQSVPTPPDELLIRMQAYGGRREQLLLLLEADSKIERAGQVLAGDNRTDALQDRKDGVETLLLMRQNGFRGIEVGLVYNPRMPNRKGHADTCVLSVVTGTRHMIAYYDFLDILTETGLGDAEGPVGGWDFVINGGVNQFGLGSRRTLFKGQI